MILNGSKIKYKGLKISFTKIIRLLCMILYDLEGTHFLRVTGNVKSVGII